MTALRALIVEDDPEMSELESELLTLEGYETRQAAEGKLGYQLATHDTYDLMVVDINLPGWDGIEMLNSLFVVQNFLPVIVVTGGDTVTLSARVSHPNVLAILQKPFRPEELRRLARTRRAPPPPRKLWH
jgi:DNA-binding response OmpR family regulator